MLVLNCHPHQEQSSFQSLLPGGSSGIVGILEDSLQKHVGLIVFHRIELDHISFRADDFPYEFAILCVYENEAHSKGLFVTSRKRVL